MTIVEDPNPGVASNLSTIISTEFLFLHLIKRKIIVQVRFNTRKVTKGNVTIKSGGYWKATSIFQCVRDILLCSFCYHLLPRDLLFTLLDLSLGRRYSPDPAGFSSQALAIKYFWNCMVTTCYGLHCYK
ncbi:hypothetical protein HanPSC8_Chr11g0463431 [Helianthus annuus]|nr:hypothetical protein HanPSC8_Chr11g0463431 [Helianthus annuus]